MSAEIVNDKVVKRICYPSSPIGVYFMHGLTFMRNSLPCSVGNASLDILCEATWKKQVS